MTLETVRIVLWCLAALAAVSFTLLVRHAIRQGKIDDTVNNRLHTQQRIDHQRLEVLGSTDQSAPARATGIRSDRRPDDHM